MSNAKTIKLMRDLSAYNVVGALVTALELTLTGHNELGTIEVYSNNNETVTVDWNKYTVTIIENK